MFSRKYPFRRPSFRESHTERAMIDAKLTRPFSKAMSLAVVGKQSHLSGILSLFQFGSPSAISRLVVAVIVNAINCCLWKRFWSHVGKERIEIGSPFIANCDASFPVQMLVFVGMVASPLHFLPRCVLWRITHAARTCAMAPARLGRRLSQFAASHDGCIATFALTLPARIAAFCSSCKLQNSEFSVDVPRLVFGAKGQLIRIMFSHLTFPMNGWVDRAKAVVVDCFGSFHFSLT